MRSILSLVAAAAACGGAASSGPTAVPVARTPASVAARPAGCGRTTASKLTPLAAQGGTVVLATSGPRTVAVIADEDERALRVVDVDTRSELSTTSLDALPGHVLVLADGRVAVTLREKNELALYEPDETLEAPLIARCTRPVATEPIAMATGKDGAILVTSAWGRTLTVFEPDALSKRSEVSLAREPRAVVVSDDGKRAFVSHAVGAQASVVDLVAGSAKELKLRGVEAMRGFVAPKEGRPTCQGFAVTKAKGRVYAPQVIVDPGDGRQRATGYGNDHVPTEQPDVAVIDEDTAAPVPASLEISRDVFFRADPREARAECILPRAAAVDEKTGSLLVTCFGIDAVVAYDANAASPARAEKRRWTVPAGPSGIAVDAAKGRAVVFSQFDRALAVIPLAGPELADEKTSPVTKAVLSQTRKPSMELALGRLLFHATGDARIARDGRACASCHPDGRDDALTWSTPDGPRRSIMLAGRLSRTAPYSWSGGEKDLHAHLGVTFDRLNGAGGLRSLELDALVAYVSSLPVPRPASVADPRIKRGAEIFASREAQCSSCHDGGGSDGKSHDLKSASPVDRQRAFNTPTLRFVGGTGPYFHDGRHATLLDVLVEEDGKMGHVKHLSREDLEALVAYLRSL